MCALYAFNRVTDDLADEPGPIDGRQAALDAWRAGTRQALAGHYSHFAHPALHATVTRYAIPPEYLEAVIDGVSADLGTVRFPAFPDLYAYCWRVASAVGLACVHIWGFRGGRRALEYAESAGIAFQLTNILRDLAEDRANGRVYLPQDELARFGLPPEGPAGVADPGFRDLMRFQTARARDFYRAAEPLADLLRPAGRAIYRMMSRTYRGILDEIEARDHDVFSGRVRLGRWRKLRLLAESLPASFGW
jgi:phytoene synthase